MTVRDFERHEFDYAMALFRFAERHPDILGACLDLEIVGPAAIGGLERETKAMADDIHRLVLTLGRFENHPVCDKDEEAGRVGRTSPEVKVMADGLRQVSDFSGRRALMDSLRSVPGLRGRLVAHAQTSASRGRS